MMASRKISQKENHQKESPAARRRLREKEQRYQTILRAAETLFTRDGFHGTGMEQIAEMAEISVGTVYFYFKNKEDLLVKLLDEIELYLRKLVGAELKKADFHLDAFKNAGYVFFEDFCCNHPEKVIILLRESVGQGLEVEQKRRVMFDTLISDVHQALNRVRERMGYTWHSGVTAEMIAVSIVGMFERMAYHYLIWQDRPDDLRVVADDAMRFIGGGINVLVEAITDTARKTGLSS